MEFWTNEDTIQFLAAYKNNPILWNPHHPDYKKRNLVQDGWDRVVAQLNSKWTIDQLKRKKESLMAAYRTCVNKIKDSKINGDAVYKPSWFAFRSMHSFLSRRDQPVIIDPSYSVECEDASYIDAADNLSISDNDLEDIKVNDEIEITSDYHDEKDFHEVIDYQDEENVVYDKIVLPVPVRVANNKKVRMTRNPSIKYEEARPSTNEPIENNVLSSLSSILRATSEKPQPVRDICDKFGDLIAEKLRSFNDTDRDLCMLRIEKIIFQMKFQKLQKQPSYHVQACLDSA